MGTRSNVVGLAGMAAIAATSCVAVVSASSGGVLGEGPDWLDTSAGNPLRAASVTITGFEPGDGSTQLTLEVSGIDAEPGSVLGAHLHVAPCGSSATDSGPHYGHASEHEPLRQREMWLDLRVNSSGHATATATRDWVVDERVERSVVIHAAATDRQTGAAGVRLACTDIDR